MNITLKKNTLRCIFQSDIQSYFETPVCAAPLLHKKCYQKNPEKNRLKYEF